MRFSALLLSLVPGAALAHEGDHAALAPAQSLVHALTAADHLAVLCLALALALLVRPLRRVLARRKEPSK